VLAVKLDAEYNNPMPSKFVHLHLHSEYSLVNSLVRIKPLTKQIAELGMPAVAITDQSNLFSMVKFYRAAIASGIKPIVGVDVWVANETETDLPYRLLLLCKNKEGYLNLSQLVSKSYLEGQHRGIPMLDQSWFEGNTEGLIALSGAREGDVGRALLAGNRSLAKSKAQFWSQLFPDSFYLELQRTGRENESRYIQEAIELAGELRLPVVATNDVCFFKKEDFEAHEARVCIYDGRTLDDKRRPKLYSQQQYLRSPEEMEELFSDIPEAIENTVEIAKRCNLELTLGENYLPDFPVPEGMDANSFLQSQSRKGLEDRLERILDRNDPDYESKAKVYSDRLEFELDVIIQMGFPGYFLIVADFIQWAKDHSIPVGPGRGSGAGSLVAYVLTITDLDPIALELLFERFLNPERVSMPDFDVDFCMDQRDRVIEYVAEHYGRDKVSQIITYGSMAAKAVVRDVGRVLSHPYGFVDRIAKLIPFEIGITLDKALEQEEELQKLYDDDEDVKTLLDLARSLEGLARNAGKHAGGVVISPTKLTDFTPIYCEQGGTNIVSQFDKDDVEAVGLVKFDFLGLRTLTIIDWAVQTINRQRKNNNEEPVDISTIPVADKASFDLLKRATTTAVFQLESDGMKDLIKRLQPDHFDDIVALVALFRPWPLQSGMVDDFIERKHGRAKVEYPHPALEPILKPTYGVILYQEQVMQIAQVLALYSLGEADLLRRAMGKKKPEEMAKQRSIFTEGSVKNGVEEKTATYIFDLMEKFAGYGFNKSHSAAYALVSYQTIWLKAHYPSAFMSAVLSSDMDNTDKVVHLIEECREMHLEVLPPNVNKSFYKFTSYDDDTIIYGLGAIKGVGEAAIEIIYEEREANGVYKDLFDFCKRVDLRKVNKRVLEALVRSGAVDQLGLNRASLMAQLPDAVRAAEQHNRNASVGMEDLFGGAEPDSTDAILTVVELEDWDDETRLTAEKETLGLYLTGHPIARYEEELSHLITARVCDLMVGSGGKDSKDSFHLGDGQEKSVVAAGLVHGVRVINTRRGRMAIVTLDDRTGRMDVTLFSELFESARPMIIKDKPLIVLGMLAKDDYTGNFRVNAEDTFSIDMAREYFARRLVINIDQSKGRNGFAKSLADVLQPYKEGRCPIWVQYRGEGAQVKMPLGAEWKVHPTDELLHRLRGLADESQVWMEYTV